MFIKWIDAEMAQKRVRDVEHERDKLRAQVEYYKNALATSAGGKVDWIVRAEAAQAENVRLQFDATEWQERCERLSVEAGRISVALDAAQAEIERLRAAAQAVIDSINDENEIDPDAIYRLSQALDRPKSC